MFGFSIFRTKKLDNYDMFSICSELYLILSYLIFIISAEHPGKNVRMRTGNPGATATKKGFEVFLFLVVVVVVVVVAAGVLVVV